MLAAGVGSRYGGLKQLDGFGPHGETLMDYSVYDALAAGFDKVVFLIRRDFAEQFRATVGSQVEQRVAVEYAFQERDDLPAGFVPRPERKKPWGTAHGIWCARHHVHEPFVSLNADDYYGRQAFEAVAAQLGQPQPSDGLPDYCVVGYPVLQTLSPHGAVARAICEVDGQGFLRGLVERHGVERSGTTATYRDPAGQVRALIGGEMVSMNMFGFSPAVFPQLERHLVRFFAAQRDAPDQREAVMSTVMGELLREKAARVRVLPTSDRWFGVTHPADKPAVMASLRAMVERGEYPSPIWSKR